MGVPQPSPGSNRQRKSKSTKGEIHGKIHKDDKELALSKMKAQGHVVIQEDMIMVSNQSALEVMTLVNSLARSWRMLWKLICMAL